MSHESFSVSEVIPAPPDQIYSAWLDTAAHTAFTGDEATVEPYVGGRHTAFGGYAEGTTLELSPPRRIVQTWRSRDFPDGSPDSRLEVTLEETLGGTMVTIQHTDIPAGQAERLRDAWVKYYLQAMKQYFAGQVTDSDGAGAGAGDNGVPSMEPSDEVEILPPKPPAPRPKATAASPTNGAPRPQKAKAAAKKPALKAAAKAPAKKVKAKAKLKAKAKAAPPKAKAKAAPRKAPKLKAKAKVKAKAARKAPAKKRQAPKRKASARPAKKRKR